MVVLYFFERYMVPILHWHLPAFLSIYCDVNNTTGFCIQLKDWIIIHAAGIEITTSMTYYNLLYTEENILQL